MTILPGSLDYLYYNGVLDHIPYEAYEYGPIVQNGSTQSYSIQNGGIQSYGMQNNYGLPESIQQNDSFELSTYSDKTNSPYNIKYSQYSNSAQSANQYNKHNQHNNKYNRLAGNQTDEFLHEDISAYKKDVGLYQKPDQNKPLKEKIIDKQNLWKGAAAVLIMAGTLFLLLKGKKKP